MVIEMRTAGAERPLRLRRIPAKRIRASGSATPRTDHAGGGPSAAGQRLEPLIAAYTATFGSTWSPVTRRKHADDFARFLRWLADTDRPATTASLDFATVVAYVTDLRTRPKVCGVWRGWSDARRRAAMTGPAQPLSANSVNAYMRPLRSLVIWLVDEGVMAVNPFRRSRRRAALNPLLPSEETPTKSATLEDLQTLERGCAGQRPIDYRDRAIVSLLVTTAARNSSVRLLRLGDIDFARSVICYRRAKGGKTLEVALHLATRDALVTYLECGRPSLLRGEVADPDPGWLFPSAGPGPARPLSMNALSFMLTRRYRTGGGSLRRFGSHRIRHATATLLVNNGMPLEEVSRYLGHSSTMPTRRYAQQTPSALGIQAADALRRAGVTAG